MRQSITITLGVALAAVLSLALSAQPAHAGDKLDQVFFRFAYSRLNDNRAGEVFTDTLTGVNSNEGGGSIGAGLDLALTDPDQLGGNVLLGEIFLNYSRFSDKRVAQASSAIVTGLGGGTVTPALTKVSVSELNVTVAPKLRLDSMGPIRPWVIPVGLAFLVNSPPSNNTSYLDVGLHFGAGVEYVLVDQLSIGADFRYTHGLEHSDTHTRYFSTGGYVGINFE
ncbi:MAG: outer membrane beta-barrel protein [Chrysiogenetes bacterium]|nr:outer membrane beta-barrel protein [Chrysiogenetes bacterium]